MMARFGLLIVWDFDGMPCWNCFENYNDGIVCGMNFSGMI